MDTENSPVFSKQDKFDLDIFGTFLTRNLIRCWNHIHNVVPRYLSYSNQMQRVCRMDYIKSIVFPDLSPSSEKRSDLAFIVVEATKDRNSTRAHSQTGKISLAASLRSTMSKISNAVRPSKWFKKSESNESVDDCKANYDKIDLTFIKTLLIKIEDKAKMDRNFLPYVHGNESETDYFYELIATKTEFWRLVNSSKLDAVCSFASSYVGLHHANGLLFHKEEVSRLVKRIFYLSSGVKE